MEKSNDEVTKNNTIKGLKNLMNYLVKDRPKEDKEILYEFNKFDHDDWVFATEKGDFISLEEANNIIAEQWNSEE